MFNRIKKKVYYNKYNNYSMLPYFWQLSNLKHYISSIVIAALWSW